MLSLTCFLVTLNHPYRSLSSYLYSLFFKTFNPKLHNMAASLLYGRLKRRHDLCHALNMTFIRCGFILQLDTMQLSRLKRGKEDTNLELREGNLEEFSLVENTP